MHGKQQDEQQEPIPIGSGRPNGAAVLRMLRPASGKPITQRQRGDGPINSSAMTPSKQGKTAPAIFQGCIFTNCTGAKSAVATSAFNYIEQHGNKVQYQCGVSVTGFQGMQRQILLDILGCMGVDVQKEMKLGHATHIVAQDVDDSTSKKLQHARMAMWRDTITIVSCKWVYDCARQWKILPAGPYMSNCTSIEAVSWQGSSQVFNHIANDPTKQTAQRTSLPARDATAALGGRAGHSAAKQPAGNAPSTRPTAVAAAMVAGTSTAPPQAMQGGSHRKAGMQSRSSVASQLQQPQQQGVQPVEPVLPQRQSAEAAIGNRESVSGTQGAVTSLTHLALQKHDEAMQFAAAASRLYAGPMPSEDTQALGLEVVEAKAATARLVAQMAEASADDGPAAVPSSPMQSADVCEPEQANLPVVNTGAKPAAKQPAGPARKSSASVKGKGKATKRGSGTQAVTGPTANSAAALKRQKVASGQSPTAPVSKAKTELSKGAASSEKLGGNPDAYVGREVQQDFEEGVFRGKIVAYSKQTKWFHIEYEDGDRQDMTWKELQPCLLPLAGPKQPSQAQAAKAKRKLQPAAPQGRAKPQTAAVAVPGSGSQEGAGASGGMLSREGHRGDEEAELADEPEKQDVCPPTRVSTGNSPWVTGAVRPDKPLLALGSMHTGEQQANTSKLTKIGVPCLTHRQCSRWDPRITHVILPTLVRSVKSLAGMAGGRWILSTNYIEACASAEGLVEPDEFELDDSDRTVIAAGAPRHWRLRHQHCGTGAFHGLHVLIYGSCDKPGPDKEDLLLIMQAGGATVSRIDKAASTLSKLIAGGLQLAIVSCTKSSSDAGVKQLLKAKVPCASSQYIVDWLAHPQAQLGNSMLFGSKMGWDKHLQNAHQSRSKVE